MRAKTSLFLSLAVNLGAFNLAKSVEWPPLNQFTFTLSSPPQSKTLDGCIPTECDIQSGVSLTADQKFGNIALYSSIRPNGNCVPLNNPYKRCSSGYLIEQGLFNGPGLSGITAYKIHPPTTISEKNVQGETRIMLHFDDPLAAFYSVYKYIPAVNGKRTVISVEDTVIPIVGDFNMTEVDVYDLTEPTIYFAVPNTTELSIWPPSQVGTTTQKTTLFQMSSEGVQFSMYAQLFDISPLSPFNPAIDWNFSPSDGKFLRSFRKLFTKISNVGGADEGVIWQDQVDWKIYLTWFTSSGHDTIEVPNPNSHFLAAAASDGGLNGEIVYILMGQTEFGDKVTPLPMEGYKVDSNGNVLISTAMDSSKPALNVYKYSDAASSLIWETGSNTLGWLLARQMNMANDGLNHQGCIAVILDGSNLDIITKKGQTSGHSWNNFVDIYDTSQADPVFLGVDMGDGFPRGVNVHQFSLTTKVNKVVYKYKTRHARKPDGPTGTIFPLYSEISTNETTFYKWSNDNEVYTQIAQPPAIKRVDGSLMIIFAGERPPLDNAKAVSKHNAPRNLGLVIVSADLQSIVSTGENSTGGFYNFGGNWKNQTNEGIIWLTDLTPNFENIEDAENAVRMKTALVNANLVLIFYEIWNEDSYIRTEVMGVDINGNVVMSPTTLPYPIRLCPGDKIEIVDGKATFYGTEEGGGKLIRYHIEMNTSSSPFPTLVPTPVPTPIPTAIPLSTPVPTSTPVVTSVPTTNHISNPTVPSTDSGTVQGPQPTFSMVPWLVGETQFVVAQNNTFDGFLQVENEVGLNVASGAVKLELFDFNCQNQKASSGLAVYYLSTGFITGTNFTYLLGVNQTLIASNMGGFVTFTGNGIENNSVGVIKFCTRVTTLENSIEVAFRDTNFMLGFNLTDNGFTTTSISLSENTADIFVTDVDTSFGVNACQCESNFNCYIHGSSPTIEQGESLVICIEPTSQDDASAVHISNLNLLVEAGNPSDQTYVSYQPVTLGSTSWVANVLTTVETQNTSDKLKISTPIIAQFFIQGHSQVSISGNAFLEFDGSKNGKSSNIATFAMEIVLVGGIEVGCFESILKHVMKSFR